PRAEAVGDLGALRPHVRGVEARVDRGAPPAPIAAERRAVRTGDRDAGGRGDAEGPDLPLRNGQPRSVAGIESRSRAPRVPGRGTLLSRQRRPRLPPAPVRSGGTAAALRADAHPLAARARRGAAPPDRDQSRGVRAAE